MATVPEVVVTVLSPYVGAMAADTCVRATAISIGKSMDSLCCDDMPALEQSIRRLLSPVAPSTTIDRVLSDIQGGVLA